MSEQTRSRGLLVAFSVLALLALVRLSGLATFILDPAEKRFVAHLEGDFGVRHNCFTCYVIAAHLGSRGKDVYDHSLYRRGREMPAEPTPIHEQIGKTFTIDSYPYPPPFLALPALVMKTGDGFFAWRRVWFVLVAGIFLLAVAWSATLAGAFSQRSALLLFPLLFLAPTTNMALQIGNVHLLVLGTAVLGAIALTRNWGLIGGLLLGFAICTKIWPGVLLVPFLFQRNWRALLWTLGGAAAWSISTWLLVGTQPFEDFFTHQLARLSSGEAFGFMTSSPKAMAANTSVFGVPHKLHGLGLWPGDLPRLHPTVNIAYTGLIIALLLLCGIILRNRTAPTEPNAWSKRLLVWLSLLTLAQLRSPFLPWPYGVVSTLWLILILLPGRGLTGRIVLGFAFVILAFDQPPGFGPPELGTWWTLTGTLTMLTCGVFGLFWGLRRAAAAIEVRTA